MKKLIPPFLIVLVLLLSQCSSDTTSNLTNTIITEEMLASKKAEVIALVGNATCTGSCNYIAFGSKPCGGPREYLLFSSAVNLNELEILVNEYNEMEHQFNIQTNAVSDCALVLPPNQIGCINGNCVIIN